MPLSTRDKLTILKGIFGNSVKVGKEQLFHCPRCNHHKKKLSINLSKNKFKCWICSYSGDIGKLVSYYGTAADKAEWGLTEENIDFSSLTNESSDEIRHVELPSEFRTLCRTSLNHSAKIPLKYLYSRGIKQEDVYRWKTGYCSSGPYAGYVIWPSFDIRGYLNFFIARAYRENVYPKHRKPDISPREVVFNELNVNYEEPIILVEGIFDAIKAGENSVPILGSEFSTKSRLFKQIVKHRSNVIVAFDKDASYKESAVIDLLMSYGVQTYGIELGKYEDIGQMSKEEFMSRKAKRKLHTNLSRLEDLTRTI